MKKFKSAFSLIEISIVILVIGLIVAGISQASRLVSRSALTSAQAQTNSSPVPLIDGLVFWLESTSEKSFLSTEVKDGGALTKWLNINPTAVYGLGEGTGVGGPTYKAKGQNNLPVVSFTASSSQYFTLPDGSVPYGDSEYTVFIVAKANSACTCTIIGSGTGAGNTKNSFGFNGSDSFINTWGTDNYTFGASLSGKHHIYSVTYLPGTSRTRNARIDGTAQTQNSPVSARSSTTDFNRIGSDPASTPTTGFFNGEVAEIIIYGRALKSDEIDDVQKYLAKKWRVTLN